MSKTDVVREFFENYLPNDISKAIDFSSLEAQKDSFIDDKLKLQVADLLYSVKFHGEPGYLYLLLEHASTPDKLLPYRMLKYTIEIMDQHLKKTKESKLPFIYPLILYTGEKSFNYSTDLFDLFGKEREFARSVFLKPYHLVDLTKVPDETLREFYWFGAAALITKHIYDPDILPIFKTVLELLRRIEKEGDFDYIYLTLSYVVEAGEVKDRTKFEETIQSTLSETNEEKKIMTLAEIWMKEGYEKGKEKGIEQGMEKGIKKGKLAVAKILLTKGMDRKTVSDTTGLSLDELEKIFS
ncbi:MAG: hypothetical protein BGO67_00015 [Alphaproteobacteria bacterium 41-28]|nr:MAG: hypothetical protein BGO67_00015 [Alphaproteobacteria bacterium 41-28]